MTITITRSYDDYDTARGVVEELEAAGVSDSAISIIGRDRRVTEDSNAAEGAGIGAGLGGTAGLLAGLGIMAIPGIGPVVAAGWLATAAAGAVAGAAAGSLIGAFTGEGVSEEDAHYYAETVRRGGTVVSVRAEEGRAGEVEAIMDGATPIDRDTRLAQYREEGWSSFDENAPAIRGVA